jgi:hypothetical protein
MTAVALLRLPYECSARPPTAGQRRAQVLLAVLVALVTVVAGGLGVLALWDTPGDIAIRISGGTLSVRAGSGPLGNAWSEPLDDVAEARWQEVGRIRKRVGTDAPGYCAGSFTIEGVGPVRLATDCGHEVVVVTFRSGAEPIVVAPRDPDAFIAALNARTEGAFESRRNQEASGRAVLLLLRALAAGTIPLGLFLAAYFVISPRRLRYRVEPGTLTVRTWLVTRRVPLYGSVARPYTPGMAIRLGGAALPGYYAGLFRADGRNLRMYATADRDGIAIDADRRVWVTPPDNAVFLEALRAAGARLDQ